MRIRKICAIILVTTLMAGLLSACLKDSEPKNVLRIYLKHWQEEQYTAMYKLLSTESKKRISEEEFIGLHKKIAATIGQERIWFTVPAGNEQAEAIPFQTTFISRFVGMIALDNHGQLVEENEGWRIVWSPSLIFPELEAKDKVTTIQTGIGRRGDIMDRHGHPLATSEEVVTIGIIPDETKDHTQLLRQFAHALEMDLPEIQGKYEEAETKSDHFIPLASVPAHKKQRIAQILSIPGAASRKSLQRVYPQKEETAHLIGYVQPIPAGQLTKWKDHEYLPGEWIGETGLEKELEEQLHSHDGWKIVIVDPEGKQKQVIGERQAQDGENIRLTIDLKAQTRWYRALSQEKGAAVALHPKTGEVLAAISAPSYDPNRLITGLPAKDLPLESRFLERFPPGSMIHPLTAAVGLETGQLTTKTTYDTSMGKWQKDSSWGNYFVTNPTRSESEVDLQRALALSDPIYFARVSIKIGAEQLDKSFHKFGFKKNIPFPLSIKPAQLTNSGRIENEIQLVEAATGKGEMQVSPLFLATIYTAFVNEGNVLQPQLILKEKETIRPEIWQAQVISPKTAQTVNKMLSGAALELDSPEIKLGARIRNSRSEGPKGKERGRSTYVAYIDHWQGSTGSDRGNAGRG